MTHRSFLTFAVPLAVAALSVGCQKKENVQSQDVNTHGMSLKVIANSSGTNTTLEAEVHVGSAESSTLAKLTTGDQLVLKITGDTDRVLQEQDGGTYRGIYYKIDVGKTSGDFVIDFTRTKSASALGNKVSLPTPFTIAPIAGPVSRKEPLIVKWDRADGAHAMTLSLDGSCIQSVLSRSVAGDPGTYTFNAGDIKTLAGSETANCSINVKVTRTLTFTSSSFSAEFGQPSKGTTTQLRTLAVDTKP